MKYKVTLNNKTYEVEVEQGKAVLLDEYEALAPAQAAAPSAAAAPAAPAPAAAAPQSRGITVPRAPECSRLPALQCNPEPAMDWSAVPGHDRKCLKKFDRGLFAGVRY